MQQSPSGWHNLGVSCDVSDACQGNDGDDAGVLGARKNAADAVELWDVGSVVLLMCMECELALFPHLHAGSLNDVQRLLVPKASGECLERMELERVVACPVPSVSVPQVTDFLAMGGRNQSLRRVAFVPRRLRFARRAIRSQGRGWRAMNFPAPGLHCGEKEECLKR